MYCLTLSCVINKHIFLIYSGVQLGTTLLRNMLWEGLTTSSLFSVALVDKKVTICKPLTYQGHFERLRFEKLLMLSFLVSVAYKGILILIYEDEKCVDKRSLCLAHGFMWSFNSIIDSLCIFCHQYTL